MRLLHSYFETPSRCDKPSRSVSHAVFPMPLLQSRHDIIPLLRVIARNDTISQLVAALAGPGTGHGISAQPLARLYLRLFLSHLIDKVLETFLIYL